MLGCLLAVVVLVARVIGIGLVLVPIAAAVAVAAVGTAAFGRRLRR